MDLGWSEWMDAGHSRKVKTIQKITNTSTAREQTNPEKIAILAYLFHPTQASQRTSKDLDEGFYTKTTETPE